MLEQPLKGLAVGTAVFACILVVAMVLAGIIFIKGQTCYAINFVAILVVMSYIMWACVYMAQMFPLVDPTYDGSK